MMKRALATLLCLGLAFPAAAEPTKWRHGIVEAKSEAGFVMAPLQQGIAAKQNLDIDYVQLKGDALLLKALLSDDLESYEGSPGGAIIAASRGADLKIIGCSFPGLMYGLFTTKDINSIQDLRGKPIGISSPGSLPDLMVRALLDKAGMPPNSVQFAVMGADSDRFRALSVGTIKGAGISTEFIPIADQSNMKLLVSAREALPEYLRFCTVVSGKTLREKRDATVRFATAQMQGAAYALSHRDETIALTAKITSTKPEDPRGSFVYDQVKSAGLVDADLPLPVSKLNWMMELLVRTGNLRAQFDVTTIVDTSIRDAALAKR
jgi:NitT/TauT family transport system substrate-binding protein